MKYIHLPTAGRSVLFIGVLLLSACGGGGGGSGGGSSEPTPENGPGESGSEMETPTPDMDNPTIDNPGTQDPDNMPDPEDQNPDDDDPVVNEPDTDEPDSNAPDSVDPYETETPEVQGTVLSSGAVASLAVTSGVPANGVQDGIVLGAQQLRINKGGALAFVSRIETPFVDASRARDHVLTGSITAQRVVLSEATEVENMRPGYRFSAVEALDVASDGTAVTLSRIADPGIPGDFGSGDTTKAIIQADAEGATSLITLDDPVTTFEGESQLRVVRQLSASTAGVALLGDAFGNGSTRGLFVQDGDGFKSVVESVSRGTEGVPEIDGCRVFLSRSGQQQLHMLDSGGLVFNATIDGNNTSSPCRATSSAVLLYEDGELSVIAREGSAVPGSTTFRFGDITLFDVLDDGRAVILSTLADTTRGSAQRDIVSRGSAWLMSADQEPRLIFMEGETLERSDGSVALDFGNFDDSNRNTFSTRFTVNGAGHVALRLFERQFAPPVTRITLHAGPVRAGQPHGSLDAPGASNLVFLDELYANAGLTGTPLQSQAGSPGVAENFSDTDRFFRIGDLAVDSQGNTYFHARLLDSATRQPKGDYIFRRDVAGQLSVVVTLMDRVSVNGRDEVILRNVVASDFGLSGEDVELDLVVLSDDSLVLHDLEGGSAVLLQFP